jgi:error-prone DNA polymerase
LDLGDAPDRTAASGLPEMTGAERVRAELEVLGLDASQHVVQFYVPLLEALGVTWARELLHRRSRSTLLVAGVKVATQTPPIRSGRRVVFLTLDDSTGPVDATFFEDAQTPYAATVFHSWLLVVRGELRRTGPKGVSLRATGAWELPQLWDAWCDAGLEAVHELMVEKPGYSEEAVRGAAASRASRPVMADPATSATSATSAAGASAAGGMGGGPRHRRVLVHASGFRQSPYADIKPAGDDARDSRRMSPSEEAERRRRDEPPRKLWHASPGSSGR